MTHLLALTLLAVVCVNLATEKNETTLEITTKGSTDYIRGCYFTNWAQYRPGKGKYMPEHYEAGLCQYIFYAFGKLKDDFTVDEFEWNDKSKLYPAIMKHKKGDLKILLSLGGWNAGTAVFKKMAESVASRRIFIDSVTKFLYDHKFDGFDLDWEYPDTATDNANYVALCKELLAEFEKEAKTRGSARLLLTAATTVNNEKVDVGYNVPELAKLLDFINLMAYDLHGAWEKHTGINAPLFRRKTDPPEFHLWNVADAAKYWHKKGMPKHKLIIGLATYGRGWTLDNPANVEVGAPGSSASKSTTYLREAGVASYYEICEMLAQGGKRMWDEESKTPYIVHGDQWISYDDVESITEKIKWLKSEGYGGAFVWTLDYDDFSGTFCSAHNGQKYPLISLMKTMLGGGGVAPTIPPSTTTEKPQPTTAGSTTATSTPATSTTESSTTTSTTTASTTTSAGTTTKPGEPFKCPSDGLFPHPSSCTKYYNCAGGKAHEMACPPGTLFNQKLKICDHAANVDCNI